MKNRIVNLLLVIFVFVLLSLWVGYSSKKAAIRARKFEPTAARLERGRYIVEGIAHCFECHSEVDWEKPGGQPREGRKGSGTEFAKYGFPWLVAPNITPDTETGAGTWTDEQLARAIREGIESQFAGAATDLRAGSLTQPLKSCCSWRVPGYVSELFLLSHTPEPGWTKSSIGVRRRCDVQGAMG